MKKLIKFIAFDILSPLLIILCVDSLLRYFSRRKRLILVYHGTSAKKQTHINGRHLPANQFEKHLRYLKNNFDLVSLEAICEMKRQGIQPSRHTIAITFDDGFLNNLTVALPLLERYNVPATFFCCSINLEEQQYVHPSDYFDIINASPNFREVKIMGENFVKGRYNLISLKNGTTASEFINSLSVSDWDSALTNLSLVHPLKALPSSIDEEVYRLLNGEQLNLLASSTVACIGSHCHSHINVKMLNEDQMKYQFRTSKMLLKKYSGKKVKAIAYPYGYYNLKALELASQEGYEYLVAAGEVCEKFRNYIFPRQVVMSSSGYSRNILAINNGFDRFGF